MARNSNCFSVVPSALKMVAEIRTIPTINHEKYVRYFIEFKLGFSA